MYPNINQTTFDYLTDDYEFPKLNYLLQLKSLD